MSNQDKQQLEKLIKDVFFHAKRKSITSGKVRLNKIVKRGFYEIAIKDLLIFTSQLLTVMLMMLSLFLKAFSIHPK